ncbi:hypothetical protein NP493_562g01051 [Ridgeia piscesae]|uniref:Uncharacterized protein n=1 Tax=Ridgeia piscesae TaxID=27915 RepID=A0AAD9KVC1_RIDPI|nr:hypothetical protein NP493_562g01051 [Ridgeia piscesae]
MEWSTGRRSVVNELGADAGLDSAPTHGTRTRQGTTRVLATHRHCTCVHGRHRSVRREATHQASARQLRARGSCRTAGLQHDRDDPRQLRPRPYPDPRPRREESGPHDQLLESIREYSCASFFLFRLL